METLGFVCPIWALSYWERDQCIMILKCIDGTYAAVCNTTQTTVYVARTRSEVERFLGYNR